MSNPNPSLAARKESTLGMETVIASLEVSADRNFWLAKVAGHGRKNFGQFDKLFLEIA